MINPQCLVLEVYFNTHSLAGVYEPFGITLQARLISILTPLRECMILKNVKTDIGIFQYSLPCGSVCDGEARRCCQNFNTHSLAGVYVQQNNRNISIISILTPLRECMIRQIILQKHSLFQYSLPCGSVCSPRSPGPKQNFNTHSLAGVYALGRSAFSGCTFQYSLPCGSV